MTDGPDPVALTDQMCAEAKNQARIVAAYMKQLLAEGIDEFDSRELALAFQQRLIFGDPDAPDAPDPEPEGDT